MEITSVEKFTEVSKAHESALIVVHFWAPWAPQCKQMAEALTELGKDAQYSAVKFYQVEAENVPELSQKFEIEAVPTCVLIRDGAVVERVNGANVPELSKKVQQQASITPTPKQPAPPKKEDLNTRLKKLVSKAPVVLFMKGDPEAPRCGFSKQIVQILNEHNVKFSTFDILEDDEVRQGLKKFSDWPTFPQLYGDGELVGGLDIVKELVESGELQTQLPQQESLEDRLKKLINQQKVMLFMKGKPDEPRCGFSKTTVGVLNDVGVKYGTFDILQDPEVRQGLKTYSDWPTFPQLYVSGELVGGLDIIKELQESGELEAALKGE